MIRTIKIATIATGLLAVSAALVAPQAFADGECLQWDVSGTWHIAQSNGTNVLMKIQQTGINIQGVAEYSSYNNDAGKVDTVGGPVNGVYEAGGILRVTVYWSNSTAGLYTGQVGPDGVMSGYSVDKNDPDNKATFRASGFPTCTSRAVAPPPPPAPPAKPPVVLNQATELNDHSAALAAFATTKPPADQVNEVNDHSAILAALAATPTVTPAKVQPVAAPAARQIDPAKLDELAAIGAAIAAQDPAVAAARNTRPNTAYQRGFDIATGLFGDPKLGAAGNTLMGPGSESIRDSLNAAGQRGFNASVAFHLARDYKH